MSIKASDDWKEHALHPEKAATGESPETDTPAARVSEVSDSVYGAESANQDINPGIEERDTHTAGPDVPPYSDSPGPTVSSTGVERTSRPTGV